MLLDKKSLGNWCFGYCLCLKVAGGADGVPTNQQTKPEEETESGNTNVTGARIYRSTGSRDFKRNITPPNLTFSVLKAA